MVRSAISYNPATLLRAKREKALEAAAKTAPKALESSPPEGEEPSTDPESPLKVFDMADEFVAVIKPKMTQMIGIIVEMKRLAEAATNSVLSDDDRRKLNVGFVEKRNMIERMASDSEFHGRKIFSGDLMRSALKIPVGTGPLDVVEVRFESLKNDATGLEGHKVDSMVNSRNALKDMDNVLARFQLAGMMFKSKEDSIHLKRRQFIEENQISEEVVSARQTKAVEEDANKRWEIQRMTLHLDLKEEQERIADFEGRETALLINRKI
jgi:flagellin-like hook-associated protein FlgL